MHVSKRSFSSFLNPALLLLQPGLQEPRWKLFDVCKRMKQILSKLSQFLLLKENFQKQTRGINCYKIL